MDCDEQLPRAGCRAWNSFVPECWQLSTIHQTATALPPYRVTSPPTSLTGPTISWPGSIRGHGTAARWHGKPGARRTPQPASATTQPSGSAADFLLLQHLFHRIHGRVDSQETVPWRPLSNSLQISRALIGRKKRGIVEVS